uniref:Peptidase S1 domain-containing protein n=1 Tax=Anopheles dirus TaxID=7168 RepID=A0A182MYH3_9DIPT
MIMTTAHCVATDRGAIQRNQISVHVGRTHLKQDGESTQTHTVQEVLVHPRFSKSSIAHDIALIKLSENVTMSRYVQPVCLWNMDDKQELIVGKNGTIVGFGLTEDDVVSDQLKQALVGVVDPLQCIANDRPVFGTHLTTEMFCGRGQPGVSACNGDSGGGMFFEVGGRWFVRGLVSFTPGRQNNNHLCDGSKHTVFTDVAKYRGWISNHIDTRVLHVDSEGVHVDYDEKLRLFDFTTCSENGTYMEHRRIWNTG